MNTPTPISPTRVAYPSIKRGKKPNFNLLQQIKAALHVQTEPRNRYRGDLHLMEGHSLPFGGVPFHSEQFQPRSVSLHSPADRTLEQFFASHLLHQTRKLITSTGPSTHPRGPAVAVEGKSGASTKRKNYYCPRGPHFGF